MTKMLAAVAYKGEGKFRIEQVDIPQIGDEDVLVKVKASSITRGGLTVWKRGDWPLNISPTILGSQMAGVITEVGKEVRSFKEGDRVTVHSALTCRDCEYCRADLESLCPSFANMGHSVKSKQGMYLYEQYHNGGLAEYVKAPAWTLHHLPDEIPFDIGAKIGTVAVAYRAIKCAETKPGRILIVTAATGGTGAAAIKCAPLFGLSRAIAISRARKNLEKVKALEPDLVEIVPTAELPQGWEQNGLLTEKIRSVNGGRGPDGMVDFMPAGADVTLQSLFALRDGGKAVLEGGNPSNLTIPYLRIMHRGLQIRGYLSFSKQDETELIELVKMGRLDVGRLITHRFSLEEANEAMEIVEGRVGNPWWVIVSP